MTCLDEPPREVRRQPEIFRSHFSNRDSATGWTERLIHTSGARMTRADG